MAFKIWWHGCVDDIGAEGPAGRESSHQEDVCGGTTAKGNASGGDAKKVVRPSQRREMAHGAKRAFQVSVRLLCSTFLVSEACYRYRPKYEHENSEIADWLMKVTGAHRNWGFGLSFLYLRNVKGFVWNHKRVYRIYRKLELNLRIEPKKRLMREKPESLKVPESINESWSMETAWARSVADMAQSEKQRSFTGSRA